MQVKKLIAQLNLHNLNLNNQVKETVIDLGLDGWRFLITDQTRGWCRWADKTITIPQWVFRSKQTGYLDWYIAHECAHAYAGRVAEHGPIFMAKLKEICPKEFWYYETNYKSRNAKAAGISEKAGHELVKIGTKKFSINPDDLMNEG